MEFVTFALFPTELSKNTTISIESNGGDKLWLNIANKNAKIKLNTEETIKLRDILQGIKES